MCKTRKNQTDGQETHPLFGHLIIPSNVMSGSGDQRTSRD